MKSKIFKYLSTLFTLTVLYFTFLTPANAVTYYVDSDIGSDSNSCTAAQNTATPKQNINGVNGVNGVMSCNPGPGDIVKFRGTFIHQKSLSQRIKPNRSGQVLYPFQAVQGLSGSTVTFNQAISALDPATDYVTVYNSRRGNSGAFAVISFSDNSVTVDTSDLPLGSFVDESAADPGDLHGAILRPVHFTAWDKNNPPVWDMDLNNPPDWPNTDGQTFFSKNQSVIMISYLKTITDWSIWSAFEIDGDNYNNNDYHIFDHLEVTRGEGAIGIEYHDFNTSYNIIQHNNFHDIGYHESGPDEIIYYGNAVNPGYEDKYKLHHDYVQIMYNKIGPHRVYTDDGTKLNGVVADGIEIKPSAHFATIWGNEVTGIQSNGCSDAPIKTDGTNTVISNNYIHNIAPLEEDGLKSCGLSVIDSGPDIAEWGASGSIVSNNIFANIRGLGILLLDLKDVKVLNNVIYNVPKDPHESDLRRNGGIVLRHYLTSNTENIEIKNNIIQLVDNYGISAKSYSATSVSDYNLIFQTLNAFYNVDQGAHDRMIDPGFIDPSARNFRLQSTSPAIDAGVTHSDVVVDFAHAWRPQGAGYDIGAYEYVSSITPTQTPVPTSTPTAIPGDANNDGVVDGIDYVIWLNNYNTTSSSGSSVGDFNGDGTVDGIDYVIWLNNYSS